MVSAAVAIHTSAAKKMKLSPTDTKYSSIEAALRGCGLPASALNTVVAALPHCLGPATEERHAFQHETAATIGGLLQQQKDALAAQIAAARVDVQEMESKREEMQVVHNTGESNHESACAETRSRKVALAQAARTFQAAKAAVQGARKIAEECEVDLRAAASRRDEAEGLVKLMGSLHEDAELIKRFILTLERHVHIDDSERTAIPCAFAKPLGSRGQFDALVIQQLVDKVSKRVADLQLALDGGDASRAERAACIEAAQKELDTAAGTQLACARQYSEAAEASAKAEAELKVTKKDLAAATKALKDANKIAGGAEVELELFSTGPLACYMELLGRTKPAPAQEDHAVVEDDVEASTPMVMDSVPIVAVV